LIIITGKIGVGKSTVCRQVLEQLQSDGFDCRGVLTLKEENNLLVSNIHTGEKVPFAKKVRDNRGAACSRFDFLAAGINFGKQAIAASLEADVLIIDEAGSLELAGRGFSNLFDIVAARKTKLNILVIREKTLHLYLNLLNCTRDIFTVTLINREKLAQEIILLIKQK